LKRSLSHGFLRRKSLFLLNPQVRHHPRSRLPPPRPPRISKSKMGSFSSTSSGNKVNEYPFQNSILYSQSCSKELSDFSYWRTYGFCHERRTQNNNNEFADAGLNFVCCWLLLWRRPWVKQRLNPSKRGKENICKGAGNKEVKAR
jgi:hypothetical protein